MCIRRNFTTATWLSATRAVLAVAVAGLALTPTAARGAVRHHLRLAGQLRHLERHREGVPRLRGPARRRHAGAGAVRVHGNRYGDAQSLPTPTGAAVRWESQLRRRAPAWPTRTLQHTVPWFPGQCYQWVPATYEDVGLRALRHLHDRQPTERARRIGCVRTRPSRACSCPIIRPPRCPSQLLRAPPAAANNPPQIVVEVDAPEPAEAPAQYGDAQWIRIYVIQLPAR